MMNTIHHGFWMYFFTHRSRAVWQYVLGGVAPDLVYFVMLAAMLWRGDLSWRALLNLNPTVFLSYLPLYPWAGKIDLIGHSLVVWLAALLLSLLPLVRTVRPFILGWGVHVLIDVFTHSAYAVYFLYPLSMRQVHSPLSYWETTFLAREFNTVNYVLMFAAAVYLVYWWWRRRTR